MSLTILGRHDRLRHLLPEAAELRITGFQSPAEDEKEGTLSLDSLVGLGAPQTWLMRVDDDSLIGFGMYPGDRLVVDRAARCVPDCYVVVDIDGDSQYRVRLMTRDSGALVLKGAHPFIRQINLEYVEDLEVFGVVRWVISYVGL
ncbi:S24 family peptidase [Pseudomonas kuykendallii]|uniref:DNA polymerase V n=1 Tax=Pseudomonas kuykendallii TaxID=1007099 RepID=A0A1H3DKV9_9PSED|nr:S24 family peptidase [Pseudomonas kuykendallii]MCQ4270244.1 S24 family peptidase [Pseudomonas kuykendallii]SDX66970.1 DNA polymerase V [Pseudomonas kuykendallii]